MNCIYKLFRLSLLLLFGMAAISDAAAQRYVADQLFKDSISVREVKIAKGDTITLDESITIPNGEPLEYRGESKSIYHVLMEHDGKLYSVYREDVMLSDDNEPGVVNVVQKEELAWRHTAFCRPFVDGYAIVYASEKVDDNMKTFMYIIGTDMNTVTKYEDRLGERLVDNGCPLFVKCGSSYLAKNHGAHRIMRPDGTFVIGPEHERGEEGWKPWNDVFGMPQRDGYIFARREIDDEDYYGYVLPNGQFRILFDQSVVYAGNPSR